MAQSRHINRRSSWQRLGVGEQIRGRQRTNTSPDAPDEGKINVLDNSRKRALESYLYIRAEFQFLNNISMFNVFSVTILCLTTTKKHKL